jgi:hypothetical protein
MIMSATELIRLHKLYQPLLVQKKEIQKKKRKKEVVPEKEAFVSRAIFHIISGVKFLFEKAFFEVDQKDISQGEKRKQKETILQNKGAEYTKDVIEIIYKTVQEQMTLRGDLYTHDKFFKEIPTNTIIKNKILEEIKAENKVYSA